MKIIFVGSGSIAQKHFEAIQNIENAEIVSLVGNDENEIKEVAAKQGISQHTLDLGEALKNDKAEAVILASPTPVHAEQAIQAMKAGKHVLIEIPMGMGLEEAREVVRVQKETGKIAMVAHTRRFNPPHQWIHNQIQKGELHLHHLVVQTYFHRRENKNAQGKPRDWADNLLWHHACHSVDLFQYQTNEAEVKRWAIQGPVSEKIGIPLDMNIGMKSVTGKLLTVNLSFNNEGPHGSWFKYICEEGTYNVRYDEITDGWDKPVDFEWKGISNNGIELQNREFLNAISENRVPNASVSECFPIMEILHKLEYIAKN